MGHGITKLFKSNDFDVSTVKDLRPVVVTKLKEQSKAAEQERWLSSQYQVANIPKKPTARDKSQHKRARKLPPLKITPKPFVEMKPLPDVVTSSTSDSEHSSQEVRDSQLSPVEKQRLAEDIPGVKPEISIRRAPDHSQNETHKMYTSTTSLTDYEGSTITDVEKTAAVGGTGTVLQPNRKQTNEVEIKEQNSKDAQTEQKPDKESKNVQKSSNFLPKELQDPDVDLCAYLNKLKQSDEDVRPFMTWFYSLAKKSIQLVEEVWLGYESQSPHKPVVVAIYKDAIPELPTHFNSIAIIKRKANEVSDEGLEVAHAEQTRDLKFSSKEQQRVQQYLTKFSTPLMKDHSNLNIVSVSKIKSKYYGTKKVKRIDQTCITLYVHIKGVIPFFEEPFPKELDKIPVDVREGTFHTFGKQPDEYHQNLMMGCQIVSAYNQAGTLGGFVQLPNGTIGCLTCCHLFQTDESVLDFNKDPLGLSYFKKDVFQPNLEPGNKFGDLIQFLRTEGDHESIGVDMALIGITDPLRYPTNGGFPNAELPATGFSTENPMVYTSGEIVKGFDDIPPMPCTVVKYGIGTEHTLGILRLHGCAVHRHSTHFFPHDSIRLHQQFEVYSVKDKPFANQGDSGAMVFLVSQENTEIKLKALGLLVGGTDHGTTIVTPIWAILERLNLPLNLLPFDNSLKTTDLLSNDNDRLQQLERDVDTLKAGVSTLHSRLEETTQTTQRTEQNIVIMDTKIEEIKNSVANKQDIEMILQLLSKK